MRTGKNGKTWLEGCHWTLDVHLLRVKMPSSAETYSAIPAFLKEECVQIVCLLLLHSKTISLASCPKQYLQYNTIHV